MYGALYSIARIIAELFRQPDTQLGFLYSDWLTMGILQSLIVLGICITIYINRKK